MSIQEFILPRRFITDRRSSLRWIATHSRQNWYLILVAVLAAFGNAALMSVTPILIGQAYNLITAPVIDLAKLGQIAAVIAVTQVVRSGLQLLRNAGFELTAQRTERNIREELYISLLGKSMTFHNLQPLGDTMARATNDVRQVNFLFSPGLSQVIGSFAFLIMPLILAPRYAPQLVLVPALFIVFYFLSLWEYLHTLGPITDEVRGSFGEMNTQLSEALDGIETVKGAAQETAEIARFKVKAGRYAAAAIRQGKVEARFLPLLLLSLAFAAGLFQALLLYRDGTLNMGQVIGFFGLLLMLDFPTFVSLWAYSMIAGGLAGARRILELMNRENNLDQNLAGHNGVMRGGIEFRDVTFHYESGGPSLENVSFSVQPGQTVAIVGQTGSSKTTLAKLINRTYDVSGGQVLVDGMDVREWNLEALRRQISIIEQDVFLFSRSISENIAFGKPGATEEEVRAAAVAAQAEEFINEFSEGYATVIGERGVTLSGGQRQRLALARAFLTDPRVLILDDSTSAIDSATEDRIQRAIFAAAQGRTTFIITHRLSQIRWADLILVMGKGRLTACGTHAELMQSSDSYRRIFKG